MAFQIEIVDTSLVKHKYEHIIQAPKARNCQKRLLSGVRRGGTSYRSKRFLTRQNWTQPFPLGVSCRREGVGQHCKLPPLGGYHCLRPLDFGLLSQIFTDRFYAFHWAKRLYLWVCTVPTFSSTPLQCTV